MRVKKKNNNGFTLVELIVALAIMALLMTAVCALMGQNSITYKKTKADISVQNSAQATYDSISDSIMQAKSISLKGYTADDAITFSPTDIGADSDASLTEIKCLKTSDINAKPSAEQTGYTDYKNLKSASGYTDVYITELVITYSVPLEKDNLKNCVEQNRIADTASDGSPIPVKQYQFIDSTGNSVELDADDEDICTVTYRFEGKNMYVGRTYKYMFAKNDMWSSSDTDLSRWLYSSSLNYVTCGSATVTGIVAQIDAENNCIGLDIMFADRNMSYTTNGMINIRNSYVLNDVK